MRAFSIIVKWCKTSHTQGYIFCASYVRSFCFFFVLQKPQKYLLSFLYIDYNLLNTAAVFLERQSRITCDDKYYPKEDTFEETNGTVS